MRTYLSVALAFGLSGWMASSAAQLDATFVGNSTRFCVNTSAGFDGNLALLGGAGISSAFDALRPDGTGTSTGKTISISYGAVGTGATPAVEFDVECSFHYTVDSLRARLSFNNAVCMSNPRNGPTVGQQTEATGISQVLDLYDTNTLVSIDTEPQVETLKNLTTGATPQRICHNYTRRLLTRLPPPDTN
jgi:hypothetical protein